LRGRRGAANFARMTDFPGFEPLADLIAATAL
jgi:hypothetical protein